MPVYSAKEFSYISGSTFRKFDIEIEKSAMDIEHMQISPQPIWEKETAFLEVLVSGKFELYTYDDNKASRFFFSCFKY